MVRGGITNAKILLLRGVKLSESRVGKFSGTASKSCGGVSKIEDSASSFWVPHPRTGIYFPKGHEWVMDDVPEGAASFTQNYWFRNVDGVDSPNTILDDPQPYSY
ncbi:hypothetical protein Lal_00011479 [Lupinus albus]|uniref:Putative Late embryogenesis abundant protein, LEA5-type n=1 Tax=Lupinus albus TaxID=3870 RepID=A0A6A4QDK8_LUPAL|nr:putative Late embryogenesis abundant protein, LEA5-type [Lupinus albus]KAF1880421.1 hypothetical protein Lal_00011479 [Lupinus albus]